MRKVSGALPAMLPLSGTPLAGKVTPGALSGIKSKSITPRREETNMSYHVIVSFAKDREYVFKSDSHDALLPSRQEDARRWLENAFSEMNCEITRPTGKVLIIDKLLAVARAAGEARFAEGGEWARQYARNVALTLGRDLVRIDVENMRIGY
jgi:hypothetical protein